MFYVKFQKMKIQEIQVKNLQIQSTSQGYLLKLKWVDQLEPTNWPKSAKMVKIGRNGQNGPKAAELVENDRKLGRNWFYFDIFAIFTENYNFM